MAAMSSSAARQIDKLSPVYERRKEMQVLCLGLSRTATKTMQTALQVLGYRAYHGGELFANIKDLHIKCWEEGLTAKFQKVDSYGRAEFDKLLTHYDAVTDSPCANFAEELIAAYPDAKVILTIRDPDSWVRSMESSYYRILDMFGWWNPLIYHDPDTWLAFRNIVRLLLSHLTAGDIQNRTALRAGFVAHNERVRSLVPDSKLLVFQARDGWEPLCRHLGRMIPDEPFPHVNEGGKAADAVRTLLIIKTLMMISLPVIGIVIVGLAWVCRSRWPN